MVGQYITEVADSLQVPTELVGTFALGTLSAAIQGRWEIGLWPSYTEPCNIFAAVILPPGSRKTAVANKVARTLYDAEAQRIEMWKQARRDLQDDQGPPPKLKRLLAGDVTSEKLAGLLDENDGCVSILDAEGGGIYSALGQYKKGQTNNDLDIYLKSHSGDPLIIDRKRNQEPICIRRPCLTMVVAIQPKVSQDLWSRDDFVGRGFLDRHLWCQPTPLFGSRRYRDVPFISREVRAAWEKTLHWILEQPDQRKVIRLSEDAHELWVQMAEEIEALQAPGQPLAGLTGAASKLAGNVARIALILHAGAQLDSDTSVSQQTMRGAIQIGRFHLASLHHVRAEASREREFDPASASNAVLGWMIKNALRVVTTRQVCRSNVGGIKKSKDAVATFRVMEREGLGVFDEEQRRFLRNQDAPS